MIGTFSIDNEYTLWLDYPGEEIDKDKKYKAVYIIVESDILIASTIILSSFPCTWWGIFCDIFKSISLDIWSPLVLGNCVHSAFEWFMLKCHDYTVEDIEWISDEAIANQMVNFHHVKYPEEKAWEYLAT